MIQIANCGPHSDYDTPIALLKDAHRRVETFIEQILRVAQTARGTVLTPEQRQTLKTCLRCIRQAAPLHNADEQYSLCPRLRKLAKSGNVTAQNALRVMKKLEADHDAVEMRGALVDALGILWLSEGTLSQPDVDRLESELCELRKFYSTHIEVIERQLLPLANQLLPERMLEELGREMAARRGIGLGSLTARSSSVVWAQKQA